MDIVWMEDKIASVQEDMEYCLQHLEINLDVEADVDLLTAPFWVSYHAELAEIGSPSFDDAVLVREQSRAARLDSMLPPALVSTIRMPLAMAINSVNQARSFLRKQPEVSLEWLMSATRASGLVMGIIGAADSEELSAEAQRAIRRDAAILGHAKNHEIREEAVALYRNGDWASKDKAAEEIAKKVNRAFRTVRGWLSGV